MVAALDLFSYVSSTILINELDEFKTNLKLNAFLLANKFYIFNNNLGPSQIIWKMSYFFIRWHCCLLFQIEELSEEMPSLVPKVDRT